MLDQDEDEERSTDHPRSRRVVPLATDRGSVEREFGIDHDAGLVFLEAPMWSMDHLTVPVIYLCGIGALLALSDHSVRAVRWRASRSAPAP